MQVHAAVMIGWEHLTSLDFLGFSRVRVAVVENAASQSLMLNVSEINCQAGLRIPKEQLDG